MVSHQNKQKVDEILQKLTIRDYTDDLVLHANTPAQPETLLQCLEQAARGNGLYENSDKIEFICF